MSPSRHPACVPVAPLRSPANGLGAVARRWVLVVMVLVAVALAGGHASIARADGDPASDYLLTKQVFLSAESFVSAQSTAPSGSGRQLVSVVQAANHAGFHVRVAVIKASYDLGSVVPLWLKPQAYAHFLGVELSLVYKQRLLVVMPNGFGFYWPGHSSAAPEALLSRLSTRSGDLFGAAQAAVRALAAADGVSVGATARPSHGGVPLIVWVVSAIVVAALGLAVTLRRRRLRIVRPLAGAAAAPVWSLRRLRHERAPAPAVLAGAAPGSPPARRRVPLLVPGLAVASALIAGGIVALILLRPGPAASSPAVAKSGPAARWPAGFHVARGFRLTDQTGHPVSLAGLRGRTVILTFIDPLCRNLCPLEAHVLNAMVRQMPVAKRPVIVAVSVDVYADTRPDLLQDYREWGLVPQWRWAVGSPAALASVWNDYGIQVIVNTKHIAGATVHEITHIEGSFVIDGTGHLRALFLWPFTPQDIESEVEQVS
jgi:cytochrome oxidase Cu insertion factor (SCO1/SenC/PrrC family)